jgi:hypothetical protein
MTDDAMLQGGMQFNTHVLCLMTMTSDADGAAGSRGGRLAAPSAASCCRCRTRILHWTACWKTWR